ncbi:MAG: ATP-dependent DNA helicase RecG [Lachnospiraceae bacterium]|nr:ATP-dependent DNA helicase RecG [Lachnospiraceae bacterium]
MNITDRIDSLKGIGPKTAVLFEKLKVHTIDDLLRLYPRTYLSYDEPVDIEQAEIGTRVTIKATIQSYVDVKKIRSLMIVTCMVKDGTGAVKLTWFNSPFLKQVFHIGQTYYFVGTISIRNHQRVMEHPEYYTDAQYAEKLSSLQPVYPLTEGLSNKVITKAIHAALPLVSQLEDKVPEKVQEEFGLMPLEYAIQGSHFPENFDEVLACRERLVFDEFFWFILHMRMLRERTVKAQNHFVIKNWKNADAFIDELPFELTDGQKNAVSEIQKDMTGSTVMNRLIQGDVGSGKTAVAEIALLATVKNGYQAAFMAPTEVLAAQHYEGVKKDLKPYGVRVELLVGSTKLSEKRRIYDALAKGEIDVLIGTHALIQEKVVYHNLALVITDEQHRFGVRQRALLSEKGNEPHVLVMSATPIPRTLAIIMYGDLDISVMKDMPANRLPIKNCVVGPKYRPTAYKFMQEQIHAGHQIYIICPMVEASENVEAENVVEYQESLLDVFPKEVHISYLHGKMSPEEKNRIMHEFAEKKIDILVSTTVIEVGINNPNATVMMIENAEKFGLAQLHQLRGRVGRGDAQSYCIMLCGTERKDALERLNILNTSNDGFCIANEDLKLRGPGDFFGVRQSGDMLFQMGDIYNNADVLKIANEAVDYLERTGYPLEELVAISDFNHVQL